MNTGELEERAKKIKAVVFDGDGVLFTGRVWMNPKSGEVLKERSHIDGQGISLLRAAGIRVAFVSGEATGFLEALGEKLNSLLSVREGRWPPVEVFTPLEARATGAAAPKSRRGLPLTGFTGLQGKDKVSAVERWLTELSISWEECAAMGDDISDYELLKKVGFAAVPAQAEEIVKRIAHYIAPREGGNGAIRDFCNLILEAKGIDAATLKLC